MNINKENNSSEQLNSNIIPRKNLTIHMKIIDDYIITPENNLRERISTLNETFEKREKEKRESET